MNTITYDNIIELFVNPIFDEWEEEIIQILFLAYKSNVISIDQEELVKVFMRRHTGEAIIKANLKSDIILSKEEQDKYFLIE